MSCRRPWCKSTNTQITIHQTFNQHALKHLSNRSNFCQAFNIDYEVLPSIQIPPECVSDYTRVSNPDTSFDVYTFGKIMSVLIHFQQHNLKQNTHPSGAMNNKHIPLHMKLQHSGLIWRDDALMCCENDRLVPNTAKTSLTETMTPIDKAMRRDAFPAEPTGLSQQWLSSSALEDNTTNCWRKHARAR